MSWHIYIAPKVLSAWAPGPEMGGVLFCYILFCVHRSAQICHFISLSGFDSMTQINKVNLPSSAKSIKNISKRIFYEIKAHVLNLKVVTLYGVALIFTLYDAIYVVYLPVDGDKRLS